MVVGRSAERDRIARLLKAARRGQGGALLVSGEAGIGKSTLLDEAAKQRSMTVLRCAGAPAERELSWAGLHALLGPLQHQLDALPAPQRAALRAALAMGRGRAPDRLAVAAGTVALLSAAGFERPLAVIVDDAHWLDPPSAEAVAFAARRLAADPVAILVAVRSDEAGTFPVHGLENMELTDFPPADARALARAVAPGIADVVADRLAGATAGHPLGLVELASSLTPEQAAGAEPLPDLLHAGHGVEQLYRGRIDALSQATRVALLAVALGAGPEPRGVAATCDALGVAIADLEPAERSRLVTVTAAEVRCRHPLVQSAVVSLAAAPDVRRVHGALGRTLPTGSDAATWHRAQAAVEPDDDLADALDRIARRELATSVQTAERAFAQAARLTSDEGRRAERLLRGAEAAWRAGRGDVAAAQLSEARPALADAGTRAEATHLLAQIETARGNAAHAAELLERAAAEAGEHDPTRAARMLSDAVEPWLIAGEPARAYEAARSAADIAPPDDAGLLVQIDLRAGDVLGWQGRTAEAATVWRAIVATVERDKSLLEDPWARYRAGEAAFSAGDEVSAAAHLRAAIALARNGGAIGGVPYMSVVLVWTLCRLGELDDAAAVAADAVALAAALGQAGDEAFALAALAWADAQRGDEPACRRNAERADQLGRLLNLDGLEGSAPALGLLELSQGAQERAIEHLEQAVAEHERRGGTGVGTPRALMPLLIEALARAGRREDAESRLGPFETAARDSARQDAQAAALRCRALLASDDEALVMFTEAAVLHRVAGHPLELARTELCLGERLRRMRRRADARAALRSAEEAFSSAGAAAWARRAGEELTATGEHRRSAGPAERDRLTPQEQQVARLVATGLTNRELASRLFLSEKTIETHLTRIYLKLGVRSRTALAAAIGSEREREIPDSTPAASA
jgi:DNA-binding CsgD family transcriptional regulator